ncbi:putative membrane protein [Marinomonas primoryensis]|uniref:Putative membrane protein n=1 Tax=Marinomonas primoryensis TaxID=178399 RepID=A0A859CUQ1_9GAMM|nr:putative membrane protein [Marinomonas primoryensis]
MSSQPLGIEEKIKEKLLIKINTTNYMALFRTLIQLFSIFFYYLLIYRD